MGQKIYYIGYSHYNEEDEMDYGVAAISFDIKTLRKLLKKWYKDGYERGAVVSLLTNTLEIDDEHGETYYRIFEQKLV